MSDSRWREARALFDEACALPEVERVPFVERQAAADGDLLAEVLSLLDAHARAGRFLAGTEVGLLPRIDEEDSSEIVRERIGPWRIVSILGRGGMGVVYLGERATGDFEQRVAIKVVAGAAESAAILKRFHLERRILATLEHPGIARLLDGGTTEDGLPYFVMEHVEGQALIEYADEMRLDARARLRLLLEVCEAVQHAHQRLVVHRDIKPGNILVGRDGRAKLLDFGIAKIVKPHLAEEAASVTVTVGQWMTPAYASPEQIRGAPTTTATDVYSLGMVLFELLVGESPYRPLANGSSQPDREVLELVVVRPSTAVLNRRPRSGQNRDATLRLAQALRGDLDTIVLKALATETKRRYGSAAELAEELERYLAGLPVRARPDTLAYRSAKFLRRHRLGVAASLLAVASMAAGLGVALWQADEARLERSRAEKRFAETRELASRLLFGLHDAISTLPGATGARELVVSTGVEYLDRLALDSTADPELAAEIALGYLRLGQLQGELWSPAMLGRLADAASSFAKGTALADAALALAPGHAALRATRIRLESGQGLVAIQRGLQNEADAHFRRALGLARIESLLASNAGADGARAGFDAAASYALALSFDGRPAEAEALLRSQEIAVGTPAERTHREAEMSTVLAYSLALQERWSEAIRAAERYHELSHRLALAAPEVASRASEDVNSRLQIAWIQGQGGDPSAALEALHSMRPRLQALSEADAANQQAREDLATSWESEGESLARTGEAQRSVEAWRRAVEIYDGLTLETPQSAYLRSYLAQDLVRMGEVGMALDDREISRNAFARALAETEPPKNLVFIGKLARGRAIEGVARLEILSRGREEALGAILSAVESYRDLAAQRRLPPSIARRADELAALLQAADRRSPQTSNVTP